MTCCNWFVVESHRDMQHISLNKKSAPLGENEQLVLMVLFGTVSSSISPPATLRSVVNFHILTAASCDPLRMCFPSDETSTQVAGWVWPSSVLTKVPNLRFHSLIMLSASALTTVFPSGSGPRKCVPTPHWRRSTVENGWEWLTTPRWWR